MTVEEKENQYLLQKIDCNCNDCRYMERDIEQYKEWSKWHLEYQQKLFGGTIAREMNTAIQKLEKYPDDIEVIENHKLVME